MQVKRFVITITVLLTLLLPNLTQAQEVSIPDANLAAAIRQEIGNEITADALLNLTSLRASKRRIRDLTGLEHATNLSVLSLDGNSISDIVPLSGLTQLTRLFIFNNNISDIAPLSGLTQLWQLLIRNNCISDISSLSRLTQLTHLGLSDNNISNVSALSGLTQLREVDLSSNNISDIVPLSGLTQLTYLDLKDNPLNAAAINTHIPAIQANGTRVLFDNPAPTTPQPPPNDVPTPEPPVVSTPGPPDLVVSNLRVSKTTLTSGEEFTLFATVENRGGNRSNSTGLQFHYSTTNNINPSDAAGVAGGRIEPLEANGQTEVSASLTAPRQAGTYYYSACTGFVINEGDSNNNCSTWVSITVVAPVTDLVVSNFRVSKTTLAPGGSSHSSQPSKTEGETDRIAQLFSSIIAQRIMLIRQTPLVSP